MSIDWRYSSDGRKILHVAGSLGFNRHAELLERLRQHERDRVDAKFDVDLSKVTNLDTSGLGLLLILCDAPGAHAKEISLLNCSDAVRATLRYARFERHFRIV